MKKKRYLIIACLLFSPSFFINVEASWSCLDWSCRNGPEKEGTT